MLGLVKNELIKIWKQTSYRIITIALCALIVIIPIGSFALSALMSVDRWEPADQIEEYREMAELEEMDRLYAVYYLDCVDAIEFFADENGDYDWKYDFYQYEYQELYIQKRALEIIESGIYSEKEIEDSPYVKYIYGTDISTLAEVTAALEALENEIKTFTFRDYMANELAGIETERDMLKTAYEMAEQASELAPDNEELRYRAHCAREKLASAEELILAYELIIDKAQSPDDWRYITVGHMRNSLNSRAQYVVKPEDMFSDVYGYGFSPSTYDYNSYKLSTESDYKIADEACRMFEYSLRHEIPISGTDSSAKSTLHSNFKGILSITLIVGVIMCGLTLSNEFSSGTVRLLLIRPKTRAKILTSKLIAIFMYLIAVMVFAIVTMFVLGFIFELGFGDMLVPDLYMLDDMVIALPSFVKTFAVIFEVLLTVCFYAALALLVSVFTKKAALSIAVPIVINSIASTVQLICYAIATMIPYGMQIFAFTPMAYIDLTVFNSNAAEYFVSSNNFNIFNVNLFTYDITSQMFLPLGIFYYLAITVGCIALSYLTFKKTQIKS